MDQIWAKCNCQGVSCMFEFIKLTEQVTDYTETISKPVGHTSYKFR